MEFTPEVTDARQLIRQTIIATLMREQGMPQYAAEAQADAQLSASDPSGPIAQSDTLQAQDNEAYPIQSPEMPMGEEMLGDLAPGEPFISGGGSPMGPSQSLAGSRPSEQEGFYDRMGPEGLEGLLGMKGMDRQMEHAQALRDKEGPTGMGGIGTRNTYVAANPLSHLASGVEKYRAKKKIKSLEEAEKGYIKQIASYLRDKEPEVGDDGEGYGFY